MAFNDRVLPRGALRQAAFLSSRRVSTKILPFISSLFSNSVLGSLLQNQSLAQESNSVSHAGLPADAGSALGAESGWPRSPTVVDFRLLTQEESLQNKLRGSKRPHQGSLLFLVEYLF